MKLTNPLIVYLPDTRGVTISPYGLSNTKLGPNVFTYSRLPGNGESWDNRDGTCPGSTPECEAICYAKRVTGEVEEMWRGNSFFNDVPEIPAECTLLRLHVSGDFNNVTYIVNWIERLQERPDVTMWVYTRSWRVPELVEALESLRSLPNVQMFASMDKSTVEMPPEGWRIAWIAGDPRAAVPGYGMFITEHNNWTITGSTSYTCPEETGRKQTCEECRYCFDGKDGDVTFLQH